MSYLVFNSKAEALGRNDQAGSDMGLAYHAINDPAGTRYVWSVVAEDAETNPRAALDIDGYKLDLLTPAETSALVAELPADWQHHDQP